MLTPEIRKELDTQLDEQLGQLRKRASDGERIQVKSLLDVLQAKAYLQLFDADMLGRVRKRLDMLDQIDQAEAEQKVREPERATQPPDDSEWEMVEVLGRQAHVGRVWTGWEAGETWLFIHVPEFIVNRRRQRERRIQLSPRSVFRRQQLAEDEAAQVLDYNSRTVTGGDILPAEQLYAARTQMEVTLTAAATALGMDQPTYDEVERGHTLQDEVPQLVERLVAFFRAEQTARGFAFEKDSDGWAVNINGKRHIGHLRTEPEAIAIARRNEPYEPCDGHESSQAVLDLRDQANDDSATAASDEAEEARRRYRHAYQRLIDLGVTRIPLATRAVLVSCWAHATADEGDAYNAGRGERPRVQLQAGIAGFAAELGVSEKQLRGHLKTLDRETLIAWQGGDAFELIGEAERARMQQAAVQGDQPHDVGDDQVGDDSNDEESL